MSEKDSRDKFNRDKPHSRQLTIENHDTAYRRLFGNKAIIRDLLLGFVARALTHHLDLNTLEKVNSSYVSRNGNHRHGDAVWKARWGNATYIYPAGVSILRGQVYGCSLHDLSGAVLRRPDSSKSLGSQ